MITKEEAKAAWEELTNVTFVWTKASINQATKLTEFFSQPDETEALKKRIRVLEKIVFHSKAILNPNRWVEWATAEVEKEDKK